MTNDQIDKIIHEISALGNSFKSHANNFEITNIRMDNKTFEEKRLDLAHYAKKCAKNCQDLRNLILEGVKDE